MRSSARRCGRLLPLLLSGLLLAPAGPAAPAAPAEREPAAEQADDLLLVDCLLPGKVRRLGRHQTYVTRARPARLPARECEIRGGEYTAYDRADLRTSLAVWLESAQAGDAEAQTYVGEIFEKGLGVPPDHEAAAVWYRRAAEQGSSRAQMNLGHLYERGLGVERDPVEALSWFRRAVGLPGAIALEPPAPRTGTDAADDEPDSAGTARREAELLQAEIARLEGELAALRAERADAEATARRAEQLEAEVARLDRALATASARAAELDRAVEEAKAEAARMAVEAAPPADAPPPVIELIDPTLTRTRGVQVVAATGTIAAADGATTSVRSIIGRVTAPAGLFSLLANGSAVPVDEGGLFRTDVTLGKEPTLLSIVAVDRLGRKTGFEVELAAAKRSPRPDRAADRIDFGRYFALIVGNDDYAHLADLASARRDAQALARLLEEEYGFRTKLALDGTRYELLSALNELRETLTEDDNLLIYYAGHGELDPQIQRGYWLPVDAERTNPANWISTSTITDYLSVLPARHVMVIADSCYSGALTRSGIARLETGMSDEARRRWLETMRGKRSRTALSSGGLQPVLDAGGGGHSVFARALLDVLSEQEGVLEGRRLYLEIAARVTDSAARAGGDQVPEYAPVRFAGHEGGDFFFVRR